MQVAIGMARPLWKGTLGCGLVSIPVELYTAVRDVGPHFHLLRQALRESGRVGIGKFVMRDRPYLAALEVIGDALVLSTLRFREELVSTSDYSFPKAELRKPELQIARQLIDALVATWDPDKYTNEYRANIMAIVKAKQKRQQPALGRQEVEADSNVVDLMERLRRSLDAREGGKTKSKSKPTSAPRASRRRAGAKTFTSRRVNPRTLNPEP